MKNISVCVGCSKEFDFMVPKFIERIPPNVKIILTTTNYTTKHNFPNLTKISYKTKQYSRGRALNQAIYKNDREITVIADIDFIFNHAYFVELNRIRGLLGDNMALSFMYKINQKMTQALLKRGFERIPPYVMEGFYTANNPVACLTTKLKSIGGYDERMVGYGAEDDDLRDRLRRIGLKMYRMPVMVFHRFHGDISAKLPKNYRGMQGHNTGIWHQNQKNNIRDVSQFHVNRYPEKLYRNKQKEKREVGAHHIKKLNEMFKPQSFVDVGCGAGYTLEWLSKNTECKVLGLEHSIDAARKAALECIKDKIEFCDVTKWLNSWKYGTFDLAICWQVAEHIANESSDTLVEGLTKLSNIIIWSAATPGQPGTGHINCQPPKFWIDKFVKRGYSLDIESKREWLNSVNITCRDRIAGRSIRSNVHFLRKS